MLTGVHTIEIPDYESLIDMVLYESGCLLAIGQAGIGKTEIPFQRAAKAGLKCIYWNLSTQEAPDLVGLQLIEKDNGVPVVRYASPEYMPVIERFQEPVLVIVDELDKCKSDLQNPLLEIFHSVQRGEGGTLNGRKLNIRGIVATGNLPDEGAFSKPINHALTNRCMTYKLESNFDAWRTWAVKAGVNPLVVAFLERHQNYLSQKTVIGDPTAYTRGSPRAWTNGAFDIDKAVRLTKTPTKDGEGKRTVLSFRDNNEEVAHLTRVLSGRVGEEPAVKFRVWLQFYKQIEPLVQKLVDKGELPSPQDMDKMQLAELIVYSVSATQAIVDAPKKAKSDEDQKKETHRVANNVAKLLKVLPPEHQIAAIKSTLESDFVKKMDLTKCADLMKVYMSVRKTTKD